MINLTVNGKARQVNVDPNTPLLWVLRDTLGMTGHQVRLRRATLRCLHGSSEWTAGSFLRHARLGGRRKEDHYDRRRRRDAGRQEGASRVDGARRSAMRLLPVGQIMGAARCSQKPSRRCRHRHAMAGNICRCGTYPRIRAAIHKAAKGA
jgi:hypothetical protein